MKVKVEPDPFREHKLGESPTGGICPCGGVDVL